MSTDGPPPINSLREHDYAAEMLDRALLWMPEWGIQDDEPDFGSAILKIAARFQAEVAQRLNRTPEKMRYGLLDWLGVRGKAAIPARLPVVFGMTEGTPTAVLATAPVSLQADAQGTAVGFETESDLNIVPAKIASLVASEVDALYVAPPGLSLLEPSDPKPMRWTAKSLTVVGRHIIQVTPAEGLATGMVLRVGEQEYRVESIDGDLVTITPPLENVVQANDNIAAIEEFVPFDGTRNWQQHSLLIGDSDLFQLNAAAKIAVNFGTDDFPQDAKWYYWGKDSLGEETDWQPLTSAFKDDTVELDKSKGEIEEFEIGGIKSRWIRAQLTQSFAPKTYNGIRIKVAVDTEAHSPVIAEGMANNTPLVLENTFYPLGREPKQFDAFYLGCQEAFSKSGATVNVNFEVNDRSQVALAPVSRAVVGESRFVGIGKDRRFYEHRIEDGTTKITRTMDGLQFERQAGSEVQTLSLEQPAWRLPIWPDDDLRKYSIIVSAADAIWKLSPPDRGAISLGQIPADVSTVSCLTRNRTGIFMLGDNGNVYKNTGDTSWEKLNSLSGVKTLCAVERVGDATENDSLIVIKTNAGHDDLFVRIADDSPTNIYSQVDANVQPLAIANSTGLLIFAITEDGEIVKLSFDLSDSTVKNVDKQSLPSGQMPVGFDIVQNGGELRLIVTLQNLGLTTASPQYLFIWRLTAEGASISSFDSTPTPGNSQALAIGVLDAVVIAGAKGDFFLRRIENDRAFSERVQRSKFKIGFRAQHVPNDVDEFWRLEPTAQRFDQNTRFDQVLHAYFEVSPLIRPELNTLYFFQGNLSGDVDNDRKRLEVPDAVVEHSWLKIGDAFAKVQSIEEPTGHRYAIFAEALPGDEDTLDFQLGTPISIETKTFILLTKERWTEPWVLQADVEIVNETVKVGAVVPSNPAGGPLKVWLDRVVPTPIATIELNVTELSQSWTRVSFDDVTNPELSWEYWNGAGWSALTGLQDRTRNLKSTGDVVFNVPTDFELSDWSGKTNYWIRARLIGGDYGKERVTITQTQDGNVLTQKIDRSSAGFTPPAVGSLDITYDMDPTLPAFLVTEDSRTVRNQSDANRAPGALVEVFTPLPEMLRQRQDTSPAIGDMGSIGRSLFVGLDGPVDGRSLNLLFIVDEQDFTEFAPLQVEALIANQFVPLTIADQTRGLGETGIVRLIINVPLAPAELFGQTLRWLRFSPQNGANSSAWRPKIRGLHINAVWASATESLTRELLGSSDGAPDHQVRVARPPVLHDTLELRVREPLSDDQREALQREEPAIDSTGTLSSRARVLSNVENLPGDWVLWNQVVDPLDESPSARVYALDEATGVIRFGDGLHGMIPPIGQDSIVAFRYQRTEAGTSENMHSGSSVVPGNLVMAQSTLNLVSPVAGVETVTAAIQSAGGVAAEGAAQVLKTGFAGLRHRQRILTLADLEDRLLEFAPEAVQAKAKASTGKIDLVVCNGGPNPKPTAAQKRQWTMRLLECASPWLTSMCKFQIVGPKLRRLRIRLSLSIVDLDRADQVSDVVQQRLSDYFDLTIGGASRRGWKLGVNATENDIAVALRQVPGLQSILNIQFEEVLDASLSAWPSIIHDDELVHLNADFLQLDLRHSSSDLRAESRSSRSSAANNSSSSPTTAATTKTTDTETIALDDAGLQS